LNQRILEVEKENEHTLNLNGAEDIESLLNFNFSKVRDYIFIKVIDIEKVLPKGSGDIF